MSASIRFTHSTKRTPKLSNKPPNLLLNGTPVHKVSGSALRSSPRTSPRTGPSRITTHLSPASYSPCSSASSSSSDHSSSFSSSSSSPASPPPTPTKSHSSTSNSPARRPRNMLPIPELTLPQWDQHDLDPLDPHSPSSSNSSSPSEHPSPTSPQPPQTFFIHNGYRYDGEVFELRPPQERSIASRPERILEHKPALLPHRQQFNRVYSEGTYNARPSSLRQMANRSSDRSSTDELLLLQSQYQSQSPQLDLPGCEPVPLPVTRPNSIRPPPDSRPLHIRNQPDTLPTSAESLCESIDRLRLAASVSGDTKLQGLLAYSAVPVTQITGERPAPHITKAHHVIAPHRNLQDSHSQSSATLDENRRPATREKRGRSYTSFAKNTPYVQTSTTLREKEREKEKRPRIWKMFTR